LTAWKWLRQHPLLYLWLPLVIWMSLIFLLSSQPDFPRPKVSWLEDLMGIGAHMFLFGVLAVLWARVLRGQRQTLLLAFLLTMLYSLVDEFHQSFVPGRTADPLDLVYDGLGAAIALSIWAWLRQWQSARSR
jgi:VanZ family protein